MRATFLAGILLLSGAVLFGQSISSPNDIVVFSVSASGSELPPGALARAGQEIRDVFVNLGSYTITSIDKHITQDEIATLMEKLKEYKSAGTGQGRDIGIGAPPLSSAEMRQLSRSLMIVVPVVTSYTPRPSSSGGYTAELETSFTFISGESADAVGHFSIRTIGLGPTAGAAASEALAEIPRQLVYEIRTVPQLRATPDIVEVGGSTVLIALGRTSGVRVGDELAVISSHELPSGRTVTERTGLLVVKEVKENISYAQVIYSRKPPRVGDRLAKIARVGFESSLYLHAVAATGPLGDIYSPVFAVGMLHTVTRGFYNLRPVLGFEVPFAAMSIGGSDSYSGPGLPLNVYVGAELNWRLWRFDIVPLAALGVGGVLPLSTTGRLSVSVGGGLAQVSVSYLITARLTAFVDVGMEQWFPLGVSSFSGWGGFYGGGGLSLTY